MSATAQAADLKLPVKAPVPAQAIEPFIAGTTVAETATFRTHLLRGGFNYRFN